MSRLRVTGLFRDNRLQGLWNIPEQGFAFATLSSDFPVNVTGMNRSFVESKLPYVASKNEQPITTSLVKNSMLINADLFSLSEQYGIPLNPTMVSTSYKLFCNTQKGFGHLRFADAQHYEFFQEALYKLAITWFEVNVRKVNPSLTLREASIMRTFLSGSIDELFCENETLSYDQLYAMRLVMTAQHAKLAQKKLGKDIMRRYGYRPILAELEKQQVS